MQAKDVNLKPIVRESNSVLYIKEKNNSYNDITSKWLSEYGNEKGICENQLFFIGKNNIKYEVDNYKVVLDHTKDEENVALWYAQQKKVDIKMLPRVIFPKNIKCGDFVEKTSNISWEIKEPAGNTLGTTMLNQFKGQKEKAHKFIIDMHKSDMDMDVAVEEIKNILSNNRYAWVEEVVLMKNKKVKSVLKR